MRPKDIGTQAETAVVRYLRLNGFGAAERRALTGSQDQGDVTGCPGIVWEVKGGKAAENASDGQIEAWLNETQVERRNAKADVGILVVKRKAVGPANASKWWAVVSLGTVAELLHPRNGGRTDPSAQAVVELGPPVRMFLHSIVNLLRVAGYGDPK